MSKSHSDTLPNFTKPLMSINILISHILTSTKCMTLPYTNEAIDFNRKNEYIYVLTNESWDIYRKNGRLLIHSATAPSIIGLAHLTSKPAVIIKPSAGAIIYRIEKNNFTELVSRENLWREVADVLLWAIHYFTLRDSNMIGVTAYQMIKYHLIVLNEMSLEQRITIITEKYITERTLLSRSRVMGILKILTERQHIIIKNGLLIYIRDLPQKI